MISPVFSLLQANSQIVAKLGSNPMRCFPNGEAPEKTALPYVTYGVFNGNPQNTMDSAPDVDVMGTQIDVWAKNSEELLSLSVLIRDTLEPHAHMIAFQNLEKDAETKNYHLRMDFDFFVSR